MTHAKRVAYARRTLNDRTERFTSSEKGVLDSRYPEAASDVERAILDHKASSQVLLHFPDHRHPCPYCRHHRSD